MFQRNTKRQQVRCGGRVLDDRNSAYPIIGNLVKRIEKKVIIKRKWEANLDISPLFLSIVY